MKGLVLAAVIAFRGATVIDGTGAPPRTDMLVVISDGRITQISPVTKESVARLPAGAEVISAEGQWILPGLIDAHVHAESEDDLQRMLRWGVTSVRLMAEDAAKAAHEARASRARTDIAELFPAGAIFSAAGARWG